ncbi:MAG: HAMP domain-containing protein [Firmicutes bacterium]|nr:HAMP domain-containing protein [Bacillota bacterium]
MSIRWRLTLWYSLMVGLTLLLFGVGLYFYMEHELTSEIDLSISAKAEEVLKTITVVDRYPLPIEQVQLPDVNVFATPNTYLQVVDRNGRILARSNNLGRQALPKSGYPDDGASLAQGYFETADTGEQRLRIYNQPLIWRGQMVGLLQVGRSMQPADLALNRLRLVLAFMGTVTVGLAATLGWVLARAVLKPIDRITNTAAAIQEAEDLERKLLYEGPDDEIGRLTRTFNAMLERLKGAYLRLAEAHDAQRRFVADASHELRTPLTTIRGNVELLQKMGDTQPEVRKEALADIASESERMSRLIHELLALARADTGQNLERRLTPLHELLGEVIRSARHLSDQVRFEPDEDLTSEPIWVMGSHDYLKQLFLILIENGMKYTPSGGEVRLSVQHREGQVGVSVIDTGIGIPAEELPHIFERFYRVDQARFGEGSGLGLSIAQWIVEQHDGKIEVESVPGEGSRFTVWLRELTLG